MTAYIIYFGDKTRTLHREGPLPELTPCGRAFNPIFGAVGVSDAVPAPDAPLCPKCFQRADSLGGPSVSAGDSIGGPIVKRSSRAKRGERNRV